MEKSIINDLYLEIQYARKQKVNDLVGFIKGYIQTGLMCGRYGWFHLTGTNFEIKMAMEDFDKSEEYQKLYQEYKTKNNNEVMGYWGMSEVVMFLTQLAIEHTDMLEKIKDKYYKEEEYIAKCSYTKLLSI